MEQVLSLSARPAFLDGLIGQEKIVASIRNRIAKKRLPKAWIFHGPLGCGKTTIARILALSLQCTHQKTFGRPCKDCRRLRSQYFITEISAADLGTESLRDALREGWMSPMGLSAYRVYILDEPQGMHPNAQRHLLKLLEDTPPTTIFILCTTDPGSLIETVRSRCSGTYELRGLTMDEMLVYVQKLLDKVQSDLPADRLVDALVERNIKYPRWIAQAVERYITDGGEVNDAADVDAASAVDVSALIAATRMGDWGTVLTLLHKVQPNEAKAVRLRVLSYLRAIMLDSQDISDRTGVVANCIMELVNLQAYDNAVVHAGLVAALYRVVDRFSKYKH